MDGGPPGWRNRKGTFRISPRVSRIPGGGLIGTARAHGENGRDARGVARGHAERGGHAARGCGQGQQETYVRRGRTPRQAGHATARPPKLR
jgi:hypothetical protein